MPQPIVSSIPTRSSTGKGGVSALDSTSTRHSPISISPVGIVGFSAPCGLSPTVPSTASTHSDRASTNPRRRTGHRRVVPEVDEREVLAVLAPRRHPPAQRTRLPTSSGLSSPHRCVRIDVEFMSCGPLLLRARRRRSPIDLRSRWTRLCGASVRSSRSVTSPEDCSSGPMIRASTRPRAVRVFELGPE